MFPVDEIIAVPLQERRGGEKLAAALRRWILDLDKEDPLEGQIS